MARPFLLDILAAVDVAASESDVPTSAAPVAMLLGRAKQVKDAVLAALAVHAAVAVVALHHMAIAVMVVAACGLAYPAAAASAWNSFAEPLADEQEALLWMCHALKMLEVAS